MKFYPIIKKIKTTMQELMNEGINYIYSANAIAIYESGEEHMKQVELVLTQS